MAKKVVSMELANPHPMLFYGSVLKSPCASIINTGCAGNQIAGLVPVMESDACRKDCYTIKVFDGDSNSFLFESYKALSFRLERLLEGIWEDLGPITGAIGAVYPHGSMAYYPNYSGLTLEWGKILQTFGAGLYRLAVGEYQDECTSYSYWFQLAPFSCQTADYTIYVEGELNAVVGDAFNQEREFDLKKIVWKDSCRYYGKVSEQSLTYEDTKVFIAQGKIVSDERLHRSRFIYSYQVQLYDLPLNLVLRLFAYGLAKASITDHNLISNGGKYKGIKIVRSEAPQIDYSDKVTGRVTKAVIKVRNQFDNNLLSNC